MAESPAHRFGQLIGEVVEGAVEPTLRDFATKYGLYLDTKGPRPTRDGNKVSWTDLNGNKHDLDFVIERDGSRTTLGVPAAFIEVAWRRYTKHSRNKAQEIQGAIMPLLETHKRHCPFVGAVLAGVFTEGALTQLKSLGFQIAYFPYETVVEAFSVVKVDAFYDEATPDDEFASRMRRLDALGQPGRSKVAQKLAELNGHQLKDFVEALARVVTRTVTTVRVLPLHGRIVEWASIDDAISFIKAYREDHTEPFIRFEIQIVYRNGDKISGEFGAKEDAVAFLLSYSAGDELARRQPDQA